MDNGYGKCECYVFGVIFELDKLCFCGFGVVFSEDGKLC